MLSLGLVSCAINGEGCPVPVMVGVSCALRLVASTLPGLGHKTNLTVGLKLSGLRKYKNTKDQ